VNWGEASQKGNCRPEGRGQSTITPFSWGYGQWFYFFRESLSLNLFNNRRSEGTHWSPAENEYPVLNLTEFDRGLRVDLQISQIDRVVAQRESGRLANDFLT
jgi:hypothetical protein